MDLFLPRIMLGKASWSTPRPDAPSASDQAIATADKGFSYLKRDLVRLVGVLAYENRMAQDRIRAHNGITVIMNMCVADERNPCTSCLSNPMHNLSDLCSDFFRFPFPVLWNATAVPGRLNLFIPFYRGSSQTSENMHCLLFVISCMRTWKTKLLLTKLSQQEHGTKMVIYVILPVRENNVDAYLRIGSISQTNYN